MACTGGAYTKTVPMSAASTVTDSPIQSIRPSNSEHLAAWNKTIIRCAVSAKEVMVHTLWPSSSVPVNSRYFSANHFNVLQMQLLYKLQPTPTATVRQN